MFWEKEQIIIRGLLELAINGMEKELAQVANVGRCNSIRENFNEYKGNFDSIMDFLREAWRDYYLFMFSEYHRKYYELTGKYVRVFYDDEEA